jgi:hypothetical protein
MASRASVNTRARPLEIEPAVRATLFASRLIITRKIGFVAARLAI